MADSRGMSLLCLILVVALALTQVQTANAWGLNPHVKWQNISSTVNNQRFMKLNTKPVMVVIHKSWCSACRFLVNNLNNTNDTNVADFVKLSQNFTMVDVTDTDEPADPKFAPDGHYNPRIIFLAPNGTVRSDLRCTYNCDPRYQFTYSFADQVVAGMRNVLDKLASLIEQRPAEIQKYITAYKASHNGRSP